MVNSERRVIVHADTGTCAGTRQCVIHLPQVFASDARNLVEVLVSEAIDTQELRDAIDACPTQSLTLLDASTGEQVAP